MPDANVFAPNVVLPKDMFFLNNRDNTFATSSIIR